MSDLQCAARIVLARHGEAEYESAELNDDGGSLTQRGRAQARGLGRQLHDERVAHVYTSSLARAVQTGELAAGVLGVEVTVREGLHEFGVGDARGQSSGEGHFAPVVSRWLGGDPDTRVPGGESGAEIADRVAAVLDDLADRHRGETVLVVAHGGAILATLSVLAWRRGRTDQIVNCAFAVLERDGDGWLLTTDLPTE
ncbi:MAG: histidine phosphatase family protein [Nocardioides sp.]